MSKRAEGRRPDQARELEIEIGVAPYAEGSCLISTGNTQVLCAASVAEGVPRWREESGAGWVTAEYGMLPRSTSTRSARESSKGKVGGRTQEIQRLIRRSLRAVTRLEELGERTIWIDCDVNQADGGTRTASITGGFVAMTLALEKLHKDGLIDRVPIEDYVAAIRVGGVDGVPLTDLAYEEDSKAEVDMNIVKTGNGRFIEIQGTAEGAPFDAKALGELLDLSNTAIQTLIEMQQVIVGNILK